MKAKYGSEEQLKAAWTFEDQSGLSEEENLELGSVKIPHIGILTQAFCEPMQNGKEFSVLQDMQILQNFWQI